MLSQDGRDKPEEMYIVSRRGDEVQAQSRHSRAQSGEVCSLEVSEIPD